MIAFPRVPCALPALLLALLAGAPVASAGLLAVEGQVGTGLPVGPRDLEATLLLEETLVPEVRVRVDGTPVLQVREPATAATRGTTPEPPGAAPAAPMAATTAAVSLGLSALLPLAGLLGVPLYSRIEPAEVLRNAVRKRIFQHIVDHPGVKATAIARDLSLGWGTVHHHLLRLRATGYVTSTEGPTGVHLFAAGAVTPEERAAALAPTGTATRIAAFIRDHPGTSQSDLAAALGIGAPAASKHLARLVREGLVTATREWRT
ncbi:MAG TPA: winged helix-turn-helix transcriptional regulator, partial [Candidatus Thermoplasmatota archaeon]|nr:winged helix-turn-helix transcriptional regulator [Candidatus Thermoplasmatota archaeon]